MVSGRQRQRHRQSSCSTVSTPWRLLESEQFRRVPSKIPHPLPSHICTPRLIVVSHIFMFFSSTVRHELTCGSEFPQLSNNAQLPGATQPSMWGGQAARNLGGPSRNPSVSIPQQTQQDDVFSPVSRLSSGQNSFRFGSQASIGQSQQPQASGGDEFPPLNNRNGNGEIGQERNANLMAGLGGFGSQGGVTSPSAQANRSGNGLLNAVTANARTAEVRSPVGTYIYALFRALY